MIYSFDIFDTLITRITYNPKGIFAIMQKKLEKENRYSTYFITNFSRIREEAELNARNYAIENHQREISIKDIYKSISEFDNLNQSKIEDLIDLEISTEKECTISIDDNIKALKELINNGETVILLSDMYLDGDVIREILVSIDEVFSDIPIYVSCDCNMTKSSGTLFTYIHNELGIQYSEWHHTGDNYTSDYLIPRALGITCRHISRRDRYPWINKLRTKYSDESLDFQMVFGIVNAISNYNDTDTMKLGKSFSGIIVMGYAKWILSRAIDDGIEELYFIARDGYVVKRVVDRLIKRSGISINTKYIYGSRKAWRVKDDMGATNNLKKYFVQNVDFNKKIAFVDANGFGISISCVSDILGDIWRNTIPVYYFSFHRKIEQSKCMFYNYCYSSRDLIELLCSATHGSTIGYEEIDGKVEPILESCCDEIDNGDYIEGILMYVDTMVNTLEKLELKINPRRIVAELINSNAYTGKRSLQELWLNLNSDETMKCIEGVELKINTYKSLSSKKIIIYGAGKAGKELFNKINVNKEYLISAWTDINHEEYMRQGLPVIPLNDALDKEYDLIIIAIRSYMSKCSAECILTELGVKKEKIRHIDDVL